MQVEQVLEGGRAGGSLVLLSRPPVFVQDGPSQWLRLVAVTLAAIWPWASGSRTPC
jgi:hypothetical protein